MTTLVLGLALFIGVHCLSTFRDFRASLVGRLGEMGYKGLYTVASIIGIILVVQGFGSVRAAGPLQLWTPPAFMGHLAAVLMTFSFVAIAAAYAPLGKIKATLKHPMLAGVKAWAFAHLLVNGDVASLLLFGAFLAWAVYARISMKKRPNSDPPSSGWTIGDALAVGAGLATTVVFMIWLHPLLIGVPAWLG